MPYKYITPLLIAALTLSGCERTAAPAAPPAAPAPVVFGAVEATNALDRVNTLVQRFTPRDAGTAGAAHAAAWIQSEMAACGIAAQLQSFQDQTPRGAKEFHNVLGTLTGTGDQWIVLLSHFDTMSGIGAGFQGANDSGSSTGLLLQLACLLNQQPAAARTCNILCAFMDGEECMISYSSKDGFHGSKFLAKQLKQEKRNIKAVICLDMLGDRDLKIMVPRNGTPSLRVLALAAAKATGHRAAISLYDGYIYDDHQAFLDLGFPAVNLIDFEYGDRPGANNYWHTLEDSLDKLSADSLLIAGQIVLEMIQQLQL